MSWSPHPPIPPRGPAVSTTSTLGHRATDSTEPQARVGSATHLDALVVTVPRAAEAGEAAQVAGGARAWWLLWWSRRIWQRERGSLRERLQGRKRLPNRGEPRCHPGCPRSARLARRTAAPAPPEAHGLPGARVLAALTWLPHGLVDVLVSSLWGENRSVQAPGAHGAAPAPPRPLEPVPNAGLGGQQGRGGSCHGSAGVGRQAREQITQQGVTQGCDRSRGHCRGTDTAVTTDVKSS